MKSTIIALVLASMLLSVGCYDQIKAITAKQEAVKEEIKQRNAEAKKQELQELLSEMGPVFQDAMIAEWKRVGMDDLAAVASRVWGITQDNLIPKLRYYSPEEIAMLRAGDGKVTFEVGSRFTQDVLDSTAVAVSEVFGVGMIEP